MTAAGYYRAAMNQDDTLQIRAEDVDAERIVAEIRETVRRKKAQGLYADPRVARAERLNLARPDSEDEFMETYLEALHAACLVDINDFPIEERRRWLTPLLVPLKRMIWKLLKFYTYRMWTQQNQVNSLLATGIEAVFQNHERKLAELRERLEHLEGSDARKSG